MKNDIMHSSLMELLERDSKDGKLEPDYETALLAFKKKFKQSENSSIEPDQDCSGINNVLNQEDFEALLNFYLNQQRSPADIENLKKIQSQINKWANCFDFPNVYELSRYLEIIKVDDESLKQLSFCSRDCMFLDKRSYELDNKYVVIEDQNLRKCVFYCHKENGRHYIVPPSNVNKEIRLTNEIESRVLGVINRKLTYVIPKHPLH